MIPGTTTTILLLCIVMNTVENFSPRLYPKEKRVVEIVQEFVKTNEDVFKKLTKNLDNNQQLYQQSICGYFSNQLGQYLRQAGFNVYLIKYAGHYNLGILAVTQEGELLELIIDPTYRQFFTLNSRRSRWLSKSLPKIFEAVGMPDVLIVRQRDLKAKLNSFLLKPNWDILTQDLYQRKDGTMLTKPTRFTFDYFYEPVNRDYRFLDKQRHRKLAKKYFNQSMRSQLLTSVSP